ncbi:MAG: hypothetical protein IKQ71_06790 [Lachnospiraceae bacterium]|nr:hypothetical protein [Lachnospiraceae bacterium]
MFNKTCYTFIEICYNEYVVAPTNGKKGGGFMEVFLTFLVSVMAGVVANYISKRFDKDRFGNEPEE